MYHINRMALLFWFRKSTTNPEEGQLQMRLTYNAEREELGSTHIACKRSQWDQENQCFKGKSVWAQEQNLKLDKLTKRIDALVDNLERDGHELTAVLIKDFFKLQHRPSAGNGKATIVHRRTIFSFNELAQFHQEHQAKRQKLGKISQATLDIQANYAANIADYFTHTKRDRLPATSLNDDFMEHLEMHLTDVEEFGGGHIEKHLKFIKQVMKWGAARGLITKNPLSEFVVEGYDEEPDTTHLSIEELQRLIDFDFQALADQGRLHQLTADTLAAERDAFVFNCFTGMHHCDYTSKAYTIEIDAAGHWLTGKRKKTGKEFFLKLLEPAVTIFQRYGSDLTNLPAKSNQKRNDSLKLIAAHVDLPYTMSTKIARKTFADLALNEMLIAADDVATMLGLTGTKRLRHYVRPRRQRISKLLVSWQQLSSAA